MLSFLKKEFFWGMGIAFIICGGIIAFSGIGRMSDEEIIARASKLGMVSPDEASVKEGSLKNLPAKKEPVKSAPVDDGTSQPQSEKETAAKKIEIKPGMSSEAISALLHKEGIINDEKEFYDLITKHKAHTRFRTGVYHLTPGSDMDKIIEVLTGMK